MSLMEVEEMGNGTYFMSREYETIMNEEGAGPGSGSGACVSGGGGWNFNF